MPYSVERPHYASEARCGRACARICGYSANNSHALTHTFSIACRGQNSSRSAFTAHLRRDNDWWTQCSRKGGFGATMVGSPAAHHQLSQELSHDLCWAAWDGDFAALLEALHGCPRSTERKARSNQSGWSCPATPGPMRPPAWRPQPGGSYVPRTSSFRGTNALVVGQKFVSAWGLRLLPTVHPTLEVTGELPSRASSSAGVIH